MSTTLKLSGPALTLVLSAAQYAEEHNVSLTITHGGFNRVTVQIDGFKQSSGVLNYPTATVDVPTRGYLAERDPNWTRTTNDLGNERTDLPAVNHGDDARRLIGERE